MKRPNYKIDYPDFVESHLEELLREAVAAINPDNAGMTRDDAIVLRAAMKNCGFSREEYAEVMARSSQDKGTLAKLSEWNKVRGKADKATIFYWALQSGWKWPAPQKYMQPGAETPKKDPRPKLLVAKPQEGQTIVAILDEVGYKSKPTKAEFIEIRSREKIQAPPPEPITLREFAGAVVNGRTHWPAVFSKELQGYDKDGKPEYNYRVIEQQEFDVDIDNEEHYEDENGTLRKRRIENPLTIERALEICKEHEIAPFLVYETYSSKLHREDPAEPYPKFRLCFVMDKPITAQEYGEYGLRSMREWFIKPFGKAADSGIKDTSRAILGTDEKDRAKLYRGAIIDREKFIRQWQADTQKPADNDTQEDKKEDPGKPEPVADPFPDLITITANDLLKKEIPPLKYVIEGILPAGFGLLAAPPKSFKSFLCLQICVAVCQGVNILGRSTNKTRCLYYDLESGNRRPQQRLIDMGLAMVPGLEFVTKEELKRYQELRDKKEPLTLANGFAEVLESHLKRNPDIGLVIVDVFGKIRTEQKRTQQLYEHDYVDVGKLQAITTRYNVCILAVHHTTKGKDENNVYNNMGGSTGLFGAADFAWIINKAKFGDKEATLHTAGRDIEQNELAIIWDSGTLNWQYKGTAEEVQAAKDLEEYEQSAVVNAIRILIRTNQGRWQGTATEIINASQYYSQHIYDSPQKVGKDIDKFESLLLKKDGLRIDRGRDKGKSRDRIITIYKAAKTFNFEDEIKTD